MSVGTNVILIFLLLAIVGTSLHAAHQQYFIKKDFKLWKTQFSVYDMTGKELKYRIKSKFFRTASRQIYVYPSKEVVGKLLRRWTWNYKADISILDPNSNRWINGNITKLNKATFKRPATYSIYLNDQSLVMKDHIVSYFREIVDKHENRTLAEISKQLLSKRAPDEYILTVFSNKFPDALYLLLFTAEDFFRMPTMKGRDKTPLRHHPLDDSQT